MDPSSASSSWKRSHISTGSTPNKPAGKRQRNRQENRIRKPLDFSTENVENSNQNIQSTDLQSCSVYSPRHRVISSGVCKSPISLMKSPVRLHKWSFEEERALVEFVGLAKMDPKYDISERTQWPAFRASHNLPCCTDCVQLP